jgi:hypothetical protein
MIPVIPKGGYIAYNPLAMNWIQPNIEIPKIWAIHAIKHFKPI